MLQTLKNDIEGFFRVFESRTEELLHPLSSSAKDEWDEEISLLKQSILNRLDQEQY